MRNPSFKSLAAAEETRFHQVRPIVLRAERVTVAAVIAVVGEVGNLVGLFNTVFRHRSQPKFRQVAPANRGR